MSRQSLGRLRSKKFNPYLTSNISSTYTISPPGSRIMSAHHHELAKTYHGQRKFPAVFVRGGTSNGLVIHARDLPPRDRWHEVLPAAMGAPDPYGRELDGMGGGISSTSKVAVLAPTERGDADVEYTFIQVGIKDGVLDTAGNCGNMSSAVGPVAWDLGMFGDGASLVEGGGEDGTEERFATVRLFNTNTNKIIRSRFRVARAVAASECESDTESGRWHYCPQGGYEMDGVPGTQSRITLSFLNPAGAKTGKALPTGNPVDVLQLSDGSEIRASLVDVSNPGVFVKTSDLGLSTANAETLTPPVVEADSALKKRLEMIRQAGATRMGLDPKTESVPKVVMLFPESGSPHIDIRCLALSMGQAHKAAPLTLALCLGAAAGIPGTLAADLVSDSRKGRAAVVIGHPSGTVEIGTTVKDGKIVSAELHRTARVLMKGDVYY